MTNKKKLPGKIKLKITLYAIGLVVLYYIFEGFLKIALKPLKESGNILLTDLLIIACGILFIVFLIFYIKNKVKKARESNE